MIPVSGASHHVTNNPNMMQQIDQGNGNTNLVVGNGQILPITHTSTTAINLPSKPLVLKNILLTPEIKKNLISISQLTSQNSVIVEFNSDCFLVKDKNSRKVILQGRIRDGLYQFPFSSTAKFFSTAKLASSSAQNLMSDLQHDLPRSQAHMFLTEKQNSAVLKSCMPNFSINKTELFCSVCQMGKNHKLPFNLFDFRATKPLEIIHTDIWGLAPIQSKNGSRYYIIFLDDFSIYLWLYPPKNKSEALQTFIQFKTMIKKQLEIRIKKLHSDSGGEYKAFAKFLNVNGITHLFTCPYTSAHNGRDERKHSRVTEMD